MRKMLNNRSRNRKSVIENRKRRQKRSRRVRWKRKETQSEILICEIKIHYIAYHAQVHSYLKQLANIYNMSVTLINISNIKMDLAENN